MTITVFQPKDEKDQGVIKHSLQRITFNYDEEDRKPLLTIQVGTEASKQALIRLIGMYQTIAESDGGGRTDFTIHENRPDIVLEGNLHSALRILKKTDLISPELDQEISADKELNFFLERQRLASEEDSEAEETEEAEEAEEAEETDAAAVQPTITSQKRPSQTPLTMFSPAKSTSSELKQTTTTSDIESDVNALAEKLNKVEKQTRAEKIRSLLAKTNLTLSDISQEPRLLNPKNPS